MRLRQDGKEVYGFGEDKTDVAFRKSCTNFFVLGVERKARIELVEPKVVLDPKIATIIGNLSSKYAKKSVPMQQLGKEIRVVAPHLCGNGKLLKYLKKTGEIDVIGKGPSLSIKLRSIAPAHHG